MAKTVVGLFDDFDHARDAVDDLLSAGLPGESISLMATARAVTRRTPDDLGIDPFAWMEGGAAAAGGAAALLSGLTAVVVAGIGPVLALGPVRSALADAAGDGAVEALMELGIPPEEAGYYAEGVRRGSMLVSVVAGDEEAGTAADVLSAHNPVDLDERTARWRRAGYRPPDARLPQRTDQAQPGEKQGEGREEKSRWAGRSVRWYTT